jgi:rfaE bifunctional protein kinase chain/domain
VIKGKEHERLNNPEEEVLQSYNGKLIFSSGDDSYSVSETLSSGLISGRGLLSIQRPLDFLQRRSLSFEHLILTTRKMSSTRVCVIGDTIVDEYVNSKAIGMSQEDPTIVVTPFEEKKFLGGAAIVAAHAKGFGAEVDFFTVLGRDPNAKFVQSELNRQNVNFIFFEDNERPTTFKQRIRAGGKTLLRVNYLRSHSIEKKIEDRVFSEFRNRANTCDLVIFSDFNYGFLVQSLVNKISDYCLNNDIMMVADSQSSSQIGDISRFKHMKLITPTERDSRLALHDSQSGLVVLSDLLAEKACAENVILKLGADGVLISGRSSLRSSLETDRLSSFNLAPADVAGAGDSLLVASSLAIVGGADIWEASYIGSLAAALQVNSIGNIPQYATIFTP